LLNLNIPVLGGEITIERVIGKSKNTIKVNGVAVTLQDLNKISKYLADIHNQFDFEKILNPENYLEIIDGFSYELTSSYKKEYGALLANYRTKKAAYQALLDKKAKLDADRDFYEYQYKELKAADLKEGEEEAITNQISLLNNYDKIYSLSQEADGLIHEDFLDKMYELDKVLEKLSAYQPQYKETQTRSMIVITSSMTYWKTLKKQLSKLDYDPSQLNDLEQRDSDLAELKRKYKKSIPDLIGYRDELSFHPRREFFISKTILLPLKRAKKKRFPPATKKALN
jgi:DNA repair protein RecN (Recombination protein N)